MEVTLLDVILYILLKLRETGKMSFPVLELEAAYDRFARELQAEGCKITGDRADDRRKDVLLRSLTRPSFPDRIFDPKPETASESLFFMSGALDRLKKLCSEREREMRIRERALFRQKARVIQSARVGAQLVGKAAGM